MFKYLLPSGNSIVKLRFMQNVDKGQSTMNLLELSKSEHGSENPVWFAEVGVTLGRHW